VLLFEVVGGALLQPPGCRPSSPTHGLTAADTIASCLIASPAAVPQVHAACRLVNQSFHAWLCTAHNCTLHSALWTINTDAQAAHSLPASGAVILLLPAVAFFGYLLNVVTTVLSATGPAAKRSQAVKQKLQASACPAQAALADLTVRASPRRQRACSAYLCMPVPALHRACLPPCPQDAEEMMRGLHLSASLVRKIRGYFAEHWQPDHGLGGCGAGGCRVGPQ
jgi:hypothetical protein